MLGEVEIWRSEQLIGTETAQKLKARYELLQGDQRPVGLIILGSLGALLTGLGIISLLAANWGDMPRDLRALISFLPLVISYGAALYGCTKMKPSLAFYEPLGIFWGLSIGAGIALISQTYHLPGEMSTFLLTWMLLLVPVIYLTRSLGCVAGYYIGLLCWSSLVQRDMGVGIFFWPLSALILPVVITVRRGNHSGLRGVFMFWSLLISTIIALGMTMERTLPGLWIIIYISFFTVLLLVGVLVNTKDADIWSKPLSLCGAGGLAVVLYLLCYAWPWEDIGPAYYRIGYGCHLWASIIYDFSLAILLLIGALVLLFLWRKRDSAQSKLIKVANIFWFAAPLVVTVFYGISSYAQGDADELCAILTSLYVIVLSLLTIASGIRQMALWVVNCGILLFLAVMLGKFFNEDFSFTAKGVVFIISGLIFFFVNMIFAKKIKRESGSA